MQGQRHSSLLFVAANYYQSPSFLLPLTITFIHHFCLSLSFVVGTHLSHTPPVLIVIFITGCSRLLLVTITHRLPLSLLSLVAVVCCLYNIIALFVCLWICLSVCLFVCLSFFLSAVFIFIRKWIKLYIHFLWLLGPTLFSSKNHIRFFLLVRVRELICLLLVQVFSTYCISDGRLSFQSSFGSAGIDIIKMKMKMFDWSNFVLLVFDQFCLNQKARNVCAIINRSVSFWLVDFLYICLI